eukprot:3102714-Pyramimonas_sp.AAC.1
MTTEAFHAVPCGATKRVRGVPEWVGKLHVDSAIGAFGGAPYGATKRVRGVPKWVGGVARGHAGAFGGSLLGATRRVR